MADTGLTVTAATVTIGQTVSAYTFFLPRLSDVRKADPVDDSDMRGDVMLGQIAAGSTAMAVGVLLSWLTGSPVPAYVTLFIAVILAAIYQYALSGNRIFE